MERPAQAAVIYAGYPHPGAAAVRFAGIPDAWETAVQLARILEQDGGGANVLVTTREQAGVHAAESFAWLYSDEEEGPVVVPGAWRGDEPFIAAMSERVREMVLFGMPPSEQEMRRLTRQLRHMERLHVVLPREPIGGGFICRRAIESSGLMLN